MISDIFPKTLSFMNADLLAEIERDGKPAPELFPDLLQKKYGDRIAGFLPDLASLELAMSAARNGSGALRNNSSISANPTLSIVPVAWKNIHSLILGIGDTQPSSVTQGDEMVLVWRMPGSGEVRLRPAMNDDLLALKVVVEGLDLPGLAVETGLRVDEIEGILDRSTDMGLLVQPSSLIRRNPFHYPGLDDYPREFVESDFFTLQWHITQKCDLHCRHCYDRSDRDTLDMRTAVGVLDQLHDFCRAKFVKGQVSFTGGNPLLYSDFTGLYREAADRGFFTAILGNPARRDLVEKIVSIRKPVYYQVSLEGLRDYNDYIRGAGHFNRTLEFLDILSDLGVESTVMMTLGRDNMDQALPLAELLKGRAGTFTFNRLSRVGEGQGLSVPEREDYRAFLERYMEAAAGNEIMGFKDNLFNILRYGRGMEPGGGCAGFGCGAAFNFVALLSDGEVHACRKYPSLIGTMRDHNLMEIYESAAAERYRAGPLACRKCTLSPVCRGCPAVTYGEGLDPFIEKDPFCFMD